MITPENADPLAHPTGARSEDPRRVVVVGSGPAGLFAGITVKELNPATQVVILEGEGDPWARIDALGGLLGVDCYEAEVFAEACLRGGEALLGPFYQWTPDDHRAWLTQRGLAEIVEDGSAVRTADARALGHLLRRELGTLGVSLKSGDRVVHCDVAAAGHRFWLTLADGSTLVAEAVILAHGGALRGAARRLIESLGHEVRDPVPAFFHLQSADERFRGLNGLKVPQTRWRVPGFPGEGLGETELLPWGFGGAAVLSLSSQEADHLAKVRYRFVAEVNWLAAEPHPGRLLAEHARLRPRQRVLAEPIAELPPPLWGRLVKGVGLSEVSTWGELNRETASRLEQALTRCRIEIQRKRLFRGETAVSGGIALGSIHPKTMTSRHAPGLAFAGQVLDYHARPGGWNLHAEWLTARIAAKAVAFAPTP